MQVNWGGGDVRLQTGLSQSKFEIESVANFFVNVTVKLDSMKLKAQTNVINCRSNILYSVVQSRKRQMGVNI